MKRIVLIISLSLVGQLFAFHEVRPRETVEFASKDGLLITADVYEVENAKGMLLLCHQAGYSRGEYNATAIKLNASDSLIVIDSVPADKNGVSREPPKIAPYQSNFSQRHVPH